MLGFIRITTNRKVVARPLPVRDVMARIHGWLELPHVHVAQPSETHFARLRTELERLGTAGNLTTDAHLAALAMERGYTLYSTDSDFALFLLDGVRLLGWREWPQAALRNPAAAKRGAR